MLWDDEAWERLAINYGEMGSVGELLETHMQAEQSDRRAAIRKLLADYTQHGAEAVKRMSGRERLTLLMEKEIHLQEVEGRCQRGEGLHVNAVLRRILKKDVESIGKIALDMERRQEMGR